VVPFDHLKPVKKFTDRNIAVKRIWQAIQIQKLVLAPAATVAPQGTEGAPSANASTNSTTPQPRRPQAGQQIQSFRRCRRCPAEATKVRNKQAREGSKKAEIVALIERRQGSPLAEIMKTTGWQAHSVLRYHNRSLPIQMPIQNPPNCTDKRGETRLFTMRIKGHTG